MQTLMNELLRGSRETLPSGEVVSRPPTALMLKAARMLKQVTDLAQSANSNMLSMQEAFTQGQETRETLRLSVDTLAKQVSDLTNLTESLREQLKLKDIEIENLRQNPPAQRNTEISTVGSNPDDHRGRDSSSETGDQSENSGLGSN